ncbi:MAG: flagellar motor protein MotA [Alphaproteobacteria bacterium]|nr:flagellar motor protein MotA [Alphaproteobacteria bacterium]
MNSSRRFLVRMIAFLLLSVAVVFVLLEQLLGAFTANPPLNGLILGVLLIGIGHSFRQVLSLRPEARWIETFRADSKATSTSQAPPNLLAPMAKMLSDRKGKMMLSTMAMRSMLDSIGARLDESRDITRYMIGLLVFLGLLGTFWGLLDTVGSVGSVIQSLAIADEDIVATFAALKQGLDAPLRGMGTAFSSSLFGLAGSLVLGFLDLQSGQAQNQFYNDLEEWLSSVTRLGSGGAVGEGDQSMPVYVQALLEQTADSLEELQRTLSRGEEDRRAANSNILQLTEKLATLTDQMRSEQNLMVKLVEGQSDIRPVLQRIAESTGQDSGFDEASRDHIRNLDVYVTRLLEEAINGRQQLANELRSEIKLLARTIAAAMARDQSPAGETPPPPTPSAATGLAATPPPQPALRADAPTERVGPRITVRAPTSPRRDDDGS